MCAAEQSNSVFTTERLLSLGVKCSEQNCHLCHESTSFLRQRDHLNLRYFNAFVIVVVLAWGGALFYFFTSANWSIYKRTYSVNIEQYKDIFHNSL